MKEWAAAADQTLVEPGPAEPGSAIERFAAPAKKYSPIFIIGPPRSGSTLLYQCLVERFRVGYFSNLHHRWYKNPALLERVLHVSRWPRRPSYLSEHGRTLGWTGPSEAWRYWYRFFPRHPQYVGIEAADQANLALLRRSMRALGNAFKRPIVIKNLPCALRLGPLRQALPEAIYLVMRRDWTATARSILAARMAVHGDYDKWWSLEPPGFEKLLTRSAQQQVVAQIRTVYTAIDEARAHDEQGRFLDVGFEDFCGDVYGVLKSITALASRHGIGLASRRSVPRRFARPSPPELPPDLFNRVEAHIRLGERQETRPL